MRTSTALPLGFALFYISLWAVSPNILHSIQEIFPPVNGILLILFAVSVFKVISAFFRHSKQSPVDTAKSLSRVDLETPDDTEIDKEIQEDKREKKLLRSKTMKLTKREIASIEDIDRYLKQMITIIKNKETSIDEQEIEDLRKALKQISSKENIINKNIRLIEKHLEFYQAGRSKDIAKLERRLSQTKDKNKLQTIKEEIEYQKQMLKALDFMRKYEKRVSTLCQSFNILLDTAMKKLINRRPEEALSNLENARNSLLEIKQIYEKQMNIEKYLLKLDKKAIFDLKKEKDQK